MSNNLNSNTRLYFLNIKIDNLSKYNIDITKSIEEKLIGKYQTVNILNINSNKDITESPQLIIGYNDYPLYNIKEGRNLVDNYIKQNNNDENNNDINSNNVMQKIFTNKNISNFKKFYSSIYNYYNSSNNLITNDYLTNLKNETIQNIKKFVSSDINDTDDINNYILFYNIDFLLKSYIFNAKQINYIELFKNNKKTKFNITGFNYIIPTSKNNPNFKIDNDIITLKIKLNLSEKISLNILSIKFKLNGDLSTSDSKNELKYEKEKNEILNNNNSSSVNIIKNLKKNFDIDTFDKYVEFLPSNISSNYKNYDDIILNLDYKLNNNILNNYIQQNNIDDKLKVFFDTSINTNFNNYLEIEYKKQQENSNFMKSLTIKKLDINDSIISSGEETTYISYDDIIKSITIGASITNVNDYTNGVSENIKFILNNIINKQIFFDNKKYNIIKKQYDLADNNNIKYDFYRSNIKKDNVIYNVYQIIITLTLLNADKKNNAYNRQKLYCNLYNKNLLNSFMASDLSGITIFSNYLKNKRQKGGSKTKHKKKKTLKKQSIKKKFKRNSCKNKKIKRNSCKNKKIK